jgi:tyrosine-protein kinase Etk/Wzc
MARPSDTTSSAPGYGDNPDPDVIDLRQVLATLRRRWWIPVVAMVLAVGAVWLWQRSQPPQYTAEALIQRQAQQSPLDAFGSSSAAGRTDEAVASQIEILRSAAVLGNAVDAVGLRLVWAASAPSRGDVLSSVTVERSAPPGTYRLQQVGQELVLSTRGGGEVDRARAGGILTGDGFLLRVAEGVSLPDAADIEIVHPQRAVEKLRRDLSLQQAGRTPLLRIRFTSPDPDHAAAVVNAVSEAYQAHSAGQARENARRRREFLAGQLAHVADSLASAQRIQLDYQEQAGIVNPQVEGQALILAALDAEKDVRTLAYQQTLLESLNRALNTPGEVDEALRRTVSVGRDLIPGAEGMFNRLQDLQAERNRLTGRYAESGREVEVLDSLIAGNKREMAALSGQALQVLGARRQAAESRLRSLQDDVRALPGRSTGYLRLAQQAEAVQTTYALLAEKYYEAQIAEAVEGGDVEVVDYATAPITPDPSRRGLRLMLGLMLGGMVGTGGAFLVEYLDRTVRGAEDAERASGVSVLARIPRLPGADPGASANGFGRPVIVTDERTPAAEAFRTLRTMVHFSRGERPRVITVSSPAPGEGKSTVAANLALTLAHEGKRVLLVDADLPRPVQHAIWELPAEPGLTDVLVERATLEEAVHLDTDHGLYVLTSGTPVPASSELVGSEAFRRFVATAREEYDTVVIDAPPVLVISDATVLATMVDGMLLVARANVTDRHALTDAVRQLRRVDAPLLGLVLNGVETHGGYGGYGYGYGYGDYYARSNGKPAAPKGAINRLKDVFARR